MTHLRRLPSACHGRSRRSARSRPAQLESPARGLAADSACCAALASSRTRQYSSTTDSSVLGGRGVVPGRVSLNAQRRRRAHVCATGLDRCTWRENDENGGPCTLRAVVTASTQQARRAAQACGVACTLLVLGHVALVELRHALDDRVHVRLPRARSNQCEFATPTATNR